jgi:UrcA family protein
MTVCHEPSTLDAKALTFAGEQPMQASMRIDTLRSRLPVVAFAVGALAIMCGRAHADDPAQVDQITISAPQVRTVGSDYTTGGRVTDTTVTARVQVDPVTLTTNSGVALLKERVRDAARQACAAADPFDQDDGTCISEAVDSAQKQVDALIARARSNDNGNSNG